MGKPVIDTKTTEVITHMIDNKIIEFKSGLNQVFNETNWKKQYDQLHLMPHEEPHARRRKEIMSKYGSQIRKLMVPSPITGILAAVLCVVQLVMANYMWGLFIYERNLFNLLKNKPSHMQNTSWGVFLAVMYLVGATINHTAQALVHELTHYHSSYNLNLNKLLALMINIPTMIPSAITFGKYHWEHHKHQGDIRHDVDLPTNWEVRTFNTPLKKILFVFLHPVFYAVRPAVVMPKSPNMWELFNWVTIITSNYLIYTLIGPGAALYLGLSTYFSMGLHPAAMHMIAEHYEFVKGQETYNYYGFWNLFNLNLGYHTEHHDFPQIPWNLLPKVQKICPEFYNTLPYHTSYLKVMSTYIFDDSIGPFARIDSTQDSKKGQ